MILRTGSKRKKVNINPKNDDDRCLQYAATIALNFDEIKKDPQRVLNIKPFINTVIITGKE